MIVDFKHYIYRSIIKDFYENNPSIKDFSGNSLNETRKKYCINRILAFSMEKLFPHYPADNFHSCNGRV